MRTAPEEWVGRVDIECPCCGYVAKEGRRIPGRSGWWFWDGEPLDCGCAGHITVDPEDPDGAYANAYSEECPPAAPCRKGDACES